MRVPSSARSSTTKLITKPIANDTVDATENVRILNRSSGMIGSSTCSSTAQNVASSASEPRPIAMICHEPQANCWPPQVVSRMISVTPAERSVSPSRSILCGMWTRGMWSTMAIANSARIPMGTLM